MRKRNYAAIIVLAITVAILIVATHQGKQHKETIMVPDNNVQTVTTPDGVQTDVTPVAPVVVPEPQAPTPETNPVPNVPTSDTTPTAPTDTPAWPPKPKTYTQSQQSDVTFGN